MTSATTKTNDVNADMNTSVADYDRFELLCMKGSPYSERVRWALKVLGVDDYAVLKHEACAGELYLRYKVGRWNPWHRVTVPVAFIRYNNRPSPLILEDGMDIVSWAIDVAQQRNVVGNQDSFPTLIPQSHRTEIMEYCTIAEEALELDRGIFASQLRQRPEMLKKVMGDEAPPDFVLPVIATISYYFMSSKYRSTYDDPAAKEHAVDVNLERIQGLIVAKNQGKSATGDDDITTACHLVGNTLTLADLFMAAAMYTPMIPDVGDEVWNKRVKYPVLYTWAKEMSKKYERDC